MSQPTDESAFVALAQAREALKRYFNRNFGSEFRAHTGPTLFMQTVLRYSDLYTSHVCNLQQLAPDHHLLPTRRAMPHEPSHPFVT